MEKWLVPELGVWGTISHEYLGLSIFIIAFFWSRRKRREQFFSEIKLPVLPSLAWSAGSGSLGLVFFLAALTTGPVSLVEFVTATQPMFVLLYAIILSVFIPKILKEELERKTILQKLIAIALMVAGMGLIV
jgi:uncharacterized membrane protein